MESQPQRGYVYRPTPKRWIAIMVVISLLLHVSLLGIASIWRTKMKGPVVEEEPPELIADFDAPEENADNTPEPTPEDTPEPTPDEPDVTPDMADEEPTPTPTPKDKPPAPPKPKLTPVPAGTKRGVNPQAGAPGGVGKPTSVGWITPKPGYPFQARKLHLTGSGGVRCTTDSSGRVISAEMSPGIHPMLDQAALSFARSSWKGPPNTTRVVPITFTLTGSE
jgi:TonB family protein